MNLYIKVENGIPIDHPAIESNLLDAFGEIPNNWEPFVRGEHPKPNVYQVVHIPDSTYEKINGVWTDAWTVRDMTPEEKLQKQQNVVNSFRNRDQAENWSAWTLDEETCTMVPPIPRPERVEGQIIFWCGAENNWKETVAAPNDGKQYVFHFLSWTWQEV